MAGDRFKSAHTTQHVEGDYHRCQPIYIGHGYIYIIIMRVTTGEAAVQELGSTPAMSLHFSTCIPRVFKKSRTSLQPRCKTAPPDLYRDNPIHIVCLIICYDTANFPCVVWRHKLGHGGGSRTRQLTISSFLLFIFLFLFCLFLSVTVTTGR